MTLQMANYYKTHTFPFTCSAVRRGCCIAVFRQPVRSCYIHGFKCGIAGCVCMLSYVRVWARTVQYRQIHVPACLYAIFESRWTWALTELLVLVIVVKVVQWSNAYDSCLWNGNSFQCLSVRTALLRACSCLLISFNKHQIPQQVFLCTCEADEVCTWAWNGNRRENKLCNDCAFLRHIFLFSVTPAHTCSWGDSPSLTNCFPTSPNY